MVWEQIGTTLAVVTAVIGAATAYLRLYLSRELGESRRIVLEAIKADYVAKEIMELRLREMETRAHSMDERLDRLEKLSNDSEHRSHGH